MDFLNHLEYHFISLEIGGKSIVLKIAEINIPIMEIVIIWLVRIGKLKDKTETLNFCPPKNAALRLAYSRQMAKVAPHTQKA